MDSVINIPGYTVLRKDRASDNHGGVCLYIRNDYLMYTELRDLACCSDHEILWVQLRPTRLPRGFSSVIVAVIYHPHWSGTENDLMRDHLFQSLAIAESKYPNCAFIVAGDFNRLDVTSIKRHFNLKQIVKKATRKDAILDFVLTNMNTYYKEPIIFPPFGLSDHNTIIAEGQTRNRGCSTKVLLKRDKRTSRKAELGRYMAVLKWDTLFSPIETCEELVDVFNNVVSTGLNILMPIKKIRINLADAPWMTQQLKSLILKRQKAFHNHGVASTSTNSIEILSTVKESYAKQIFISLKLNILKRKTQEYGGKKLKEYAVRREIQLL